MQRLLDVFTKASRFRPCFQNNMLIIAGLGNPEDEYKGTRHNIGFECINKMAYDHNISVVKKKHRGLIGTGNICGKQVVLVKPQTYMNRSGECIKAVLDFYKLSPAELIVIYDDVSLPLGNIRVRERGSSGGQKGMNDIIYQLGTDEFIRIRIGIDAKPEDSRISLADYVLSRFYPNEFESMIKGVTRAGEALERILREDVASAMNLFNRR